MAHASEETIMQFSALMEQLEEPLKTTFEHVHQGYPRGTLVRFLKAVEWNVPKAHKMLMDALNWRLQNEIDTVLAKPISPSALYRSIRDTLLVGLTGDFKQWLGRRQTVYLSRCAPPMILDCDADGTITSLHPGLVTQRGGSGAVLVEPNNGSRCAPPMILYCDADGTITSLHPGLVTQRGGSGAVPVEPNNGTIEVGGRNILRATAPVPSTSGAFNEIMSAESSSGLIVRRGGEGDAVGVQLNGGRLRSTAGARGHGGSQAVFFDAAGGGFLVIHINTTPQPGDQGLVAAAHRAEDGPGDLAWRALPSLIGGLVPLCFNLLIDDNILKVGGSPGYIKAAAYAGLGLVTGFTFLGLASKKWAMAATRVVASTSMAAVSIAVVYQVSDNVYIRCVCGIMGCVATLGTMAIGW